MVEAAPIWSEECDQKRVKVEVFSEVSGGTAADREGSAIDDERAWREIPTSIVHHHETREGTPDMHRATKVIFPTEWGESSLNYDNNVREYVDPRGGEGPLTKGRVYFKEGETDEWVLKHVGFIAGAANQNELESRCWIYDFATMADAVPFGETYNQPTVKQVLGDIVDTLQRETPIPLADKAFVQGPFVDSNFEQLPDEFAKAIVGSEIGLKGDPALATGERDFTDQIQFSNAFEGGADSGEVLEELNVDTGLPFINSKKFQKNRHTVVDALEWLSSKTGCMWEFAPTPDGDGVALVISLTPNRRTFIQDSALEALQNGNIAPFYQPTGRFERTYRVLDTVKVLENTALVQINPYNAVEIRGAASKITETDIGRPEKFDIEKDRTFQTRVYPYVKVRHRGLYQAAGSTELAKRFDTDAQSIEQATGDAEKYLREILSSADEGSIELEGHPFVTPYDRLDAFETCEDFVEIQPDPVSYEVTKVTHKQEYGGPFTSEVSADIYAGEDAFEIVEAVMKEA